MDRHCSGGSTHGRSIGKGFVEVEQAAQLVLGHAGFGQDALNGLFETIQRLGRVALLAISRRNIDADLARMPLDGEHIIAGQIAGRVIPELPNADPFHETSPV